MSLRNLFTGSEQVPIPEIDVEAGRLRVPKPEPQAGGQDGSPGEPQDSRDVELPKTTWF